MKKQAFALYTSDMAWIKRNGGVVGADGRVTIQVATFNVKKTMFAGVPHLRAFLQDVPNDIMNCWVMCPVAWIGK